MQIKPEFTASGNCLVCGKEITISYGRAPNITKYCPDRECTMIAGHIRLAINGLKCLGIEPSWEEMKRIYELTNVAYNP